MSKQNYAFPLTKTETQENRLKNAIDNNIFLNIIKALTLIVTIPLGIAIVIGFIIFCSPVLDDPILSVVASTFLLFIAAILWPVVKLLYATMINKIENTEEDNGEAIIKKIKESDKTNDSVPSILDSKVKGLPTVCDEKKSVVLEPRKGISFAGIIWGYLGLKFAGKMLKKYINK